MPRRRTEEVAEIITDRLMNREADGSREWVRARVLRWGTEIARLTEHNPTFVPPRVDDPRAVPCFVLGPDHVPVQLYREWVDVQDGSRTILGDKDGHVRWAD